MHWILWATLSFAVGWLIHALFFPIAVPPAPQQQPPSDLRGSLRALSRGRGWEVRVSPPPEPPPPAPDQVPVGVRRVLLVLLVVVVFFLLYASTFQYFGWQSAYNLEEIVATQRLVFVIFWGAMGFLASTYRKNIAAARSSIFNVVSNKDNTVLWPVQAALALGLFVGIVLAINPAIIGRVTAFKAGGVEADFSANAAKITNAPVKLLDVSRTASVSGWVKYKLLSIDWKKDVGDHYTSKESNWREQMYRLAGVQYSRTALAQLIFDKQFSPIFETISCFEAIDEIDLVQNDDRLMEFALGFASLIKQNLAGEVKRSAIEGRLVELGVDANKVVEALRLRLPRFARAEECLNNLHGEWDPVRQLDQVSFDESGNQYKTLIDRSSSKETANVWDLYVVAAVADLIAFTEDERARAEFLERVRETNVDSFVLCGPDCKFVVPSITNFYYYVNEAKVKSETPWPIDEEIADMRTALTTIDEILADREQMKRKQALGGPLDDSDIDGIQHHYRLLKLQDLSLGLEILYQRALAGEHLHPADLATWRAWLDETRQILSAVEEAGVLTGLKELSLWQQAKDFIDQDPKTLFDAATASALSLVLLPAQSSVPTSADCLAARSLANYARNLTYKGLKALVPHSDQSNPIRGFVVQIESRIDADCGLLGTTLQ